MTSFQTTSTSVTVNPGRGLTWSLSGATISVQGDYRINYWVSNSGSFDASVSGASMSVSVTPNATATGETTITSTGSTCHIERVRIQLHGMPSWLCNLFIGAVEGAMRDHLCKTAQDEVNEGMARELFILPVTMPVGHDDQYQIDYRLVAAPAFASGYMESFHKGEFFNAGDSTEAPFQPSPLPSPASAEHMGTFWVSKYVLDTAGYVLQKRGVMRYSFTKNDLVPAAQSRDRLSTTCSLLDGCIGALVPSVGEMYPNASVEIEMFSSAAPVARINPQCLTGYFAGVAVFRARLSDGSLAHLFGMNVRAKTNVTLRLDGSVLKATVASMENTLAVADTSVGPMSTALLGLAFDVAKDTYIIPKLNEAGEKGFPLPTQYVQLTNAEVKLENDCVCVFTDVKYNSTIR